MVEYLLISEDSRGHSDTLYSYHTYQDAHAAMKWQMQALASLGCTLFSLERFVPQSKVHFASKLYDGDVESLWYDDPENQRCALALKVRAL